MTLLFFPSYRTGPIWRTRRCREHWDTTTNWTLSGKSLDKDFYSGMSVQRHPRLKIRQAIHDIFNIFESILPVGYWPNTIKRSLNEWQNLCPCHVHQVHENSRRDNERTDGPAGAHGVRHRRTNLHQRGMLRNSGKTSPWTTYYYYSRRCLSEAAWTIVESGARGRSLVSVLHRQTWSLSSLKIALGWYFPEVKKDKNSIGSFDYPDGPCWKDFLSVPFYFWMNCKSQSLCAYVTLMIFFSVSSHAL